MQTNLDTELARRAAHGLFPRTIKQVSEALAFIGYKLDRSLDCSHVARIISGDGEGNTYPATSTSIKESDTGLSFSNVDARRDQNFKALQAMRLEGILFAVVNGKILEI